MSANHTPGPWTVYHGADGSADVCSASPVRFNLTTAGTAIVAHICAHEDAERFSGKANACLIAAAPSYFDAAHWIAEAVANNAAPVNPMAALKELALEGKHITLDAGLVLDLLTAHAKATGGEA